MPKQLPHSTLWTTSICLITCSLMLFMVSGCSSATNRRASQTVTNTVSTSTASSPPESTVDPSTRIPSADDSSKLDYILVAKSDGVGTPLEIGTVNPGSGTYTKFEDFPADANSTPAGPGRRLSPDLTKVAAVKQLAQNDTVGGWYTADGNFHQATPDMAPQDFTTSYQVVDAYFDFQGRFYYTLQDLRGGVERKVYRAEANDANGGRFLEDTTYQGPVLTPTGNEISLFACAASDGISIFRPNGYIRVGVNQIVAGTFAEDGSCNGEDTKLLPEGSGTQVYSPAVATRDGKRVAFFAQSNGRKRLYTVPIDGSTQPALASGSDGWQNFLLLSWRS